MPLIYKSPELSPDSFRAVDARRQFLAASAANKLNNAMAYEQPNVVSEAVAEMQAKISPPQEAMPIIDPSRIQGPAAAALEGAAYQSTEEEANLRAIQARVDDAFTLSQDSHEYPLSA